MEKSDIVLEESTPIRRLGSKVRMLAAAALALGASSQQAATATRDFSTTLDLRDLKASARNRSPSFKPYVNKRTGEPHGRSGDKLIRKAMRKQVGRAVLR